MKYPWENGKEKVNHADNGYDVECTHTGQKRAYGDTFREFTVKTDKPEDEVKSYCTERVYKCGLTSTEYLKDERAGVKDFGDHFRSNYSLRKIKDGEYFYQVVKPSTH
jgi:hypothetical protein